MTRTMASSSVVSTSRIDSPTASVVSNAFSILHAGREMLGQPVQFGKHQAVHFESIRGRKLGDAEAHRVVAVEHQV